MARKNSGGVSYSKLIEKVLIFIYILVLLYFFYSRDFSISSWAILFFITFIFLFLIIGIKIIRSIRWIITHVIEGYFITFLYKIGLGKIAVKFINLLNDEDIKGDKDYTSFKQYWERKKVFGRIIDKQFLDLSLDIGKDSLYVAKHFVHQKKEKIAEQDAALTKKQLNDLSGADVEKLLCRLFEAMGYTVEKTGKVSDQTCELIILLGEQKLLLQARHYKSSPVGSTDIQEALNSQKQHACNSTMVISVSDFTNEAVELAKSNTVGLVDNDRLKELLAQYLKESWH